MVSLKPPPWQGTALSVALWHQIPCLICAFCILILPPPGRQPSGSIWFPLVFHCAGGVDFSLFNTHINSQVSITPLAYTLTPWGGVLNSLPEGRGKGSLPPSLAHLLFLPLNNLNAQFLPKLSWQATLEDWQTLGDLPWLNSLSGFLHHLTNNTIHTAWLFAQCFPALFCREGEMVVLWTLKNPLKFLFLNILFLQPSTKKQFFQEQEQGFSWFQDLWKPLTLTYTHTLY